MIRSKLSFAAYFWTLLPACFVTLGIVFLVHPQWRFKNKFGGMNSAIVPGIILVVLMGAILAFLLLQIVILIVHRDKLCLYSLRGNRRIEREEILSIDLWGRSRFNGKPSKMIRIELQGGEKIDFNGWSCRFRVTADDPAQKTLAGPGRQAKEKRYSRKHPEPWNKNLFLISIL